MTNKAKQDLKKLKRADLLELLIEQGKENEELRQALETAQKLANQREIKIREAGSIAEASLRLSGIFEAAEEASAQYTLNIKRLSDEQERINQEILVKTRTRAEKFLKDTQAKCQAMEGATERRCSKMVGDARREAEEVWVQLSGRLKAFYEAHEGLQDLLPAELKSADEVVSEARKRRARTK